jgi:hypothetical protein
VAHNKTLIIYGRINKIKKAAIKITRSLLVYGFLGIR